jgi:large subunit ribosomal protein L15
MKLGELKPAKGARKKRKRIGCGPGSGHGKTSCRGHKGQNSRSGAKSPPWFEGGQMPLQRRVPKRGFHNLFKTIYEVVNIKDLARLSDQAEVDPKSLREAGLVKKRHTKVKLLGDGDIDRKVKVTVHACTKSARERVEKAGGEILIIEK